MPYALVRPVPDSYARATTRVPASIDLDRARAQHAAYVDALRALGFAVSALPPHPSPDAMFVEDQAVIFRDRALITRSGHPGRRDEAESVAVALAALTPTRMSVGTLDGGDVLAIGDHLYVGRSARTDEAGVTALRRAFEPMGAVVEEVPVEDLHLQCVVTAPVEGLVLVAAGAVGPGHFEGALVLPPEEAYAANAVGRGRTVLLPAGFPWTKREIERRGYEVVVLEMSEIRAGDGALTCLSLRW